MTSTATDNYTHVTREEIGEFAEAYSTAITWANAYTENGEAWEDHTSVKLTEETQDVLWQDCVDFLSPEVFALIMAEVRHGESGYSLSQAGHDFALTRNGHGAGFWDRGIGAIGEALSEIARPYGARSVMVDSDGTGTIFE